MGFRHIHELYELLLQFLERLAPCLVFCSAFEAQLLPEAQLTLEGSAREAIGELEGAYASV